MNELKAALKSSLKKANDTFNLDSNSSSSLNNSDLADIDLNLNSKTISGKGSRFTHNEKLQFTKEENEQNVSVITSSTEEVIISFKII